MGGLRRGTTPTASFHVDDINLNGWNCYLTLKSPGTQIDKSGEDVQIVPDEYGDGCTVWATYTQEETLAFTAGQRCLFQLRAEKDGVALASDVFSIPVEKVLMEGVV